MNIAVINTGGTISCVGDPLSPMPAKDFAQAGEAFLTPILRRQFPDTEVSYLTDVSFPESASHTLDSANLQPTDWCVMAQGVLRRYEDFDGFVILHGTDSMGFTGAALSFLLNAFDADGNGTAVLSKPVVITGSQLPMFCRKDDGSELGLNFNTDAYQNICGAVASARTGIPEVCVYFRNRLYRGNRILKTNAGGFNAFSSPNYPALAEYGVSLALFSQNWLPGPVREGVSLDDGDVLAGLRSGVDAVRGVIDEFPIMQFNAFPARYATSPASAAIADLINSVVATGVKGIILESYGEGNFPSGAPDAPEKGAVYQALSAANAKGVHLVDCTQVITGVVDNSAYASGAWLSQVGVLNPADMSPMAALAKLMILLSFAKLRGWTHAQVQTLFQSDLAGEMRTVNGLDSRTRCALLPGQSITALDGSATLINEPASGPVLYGGAKRLWSLPTKLSAKDLPGKLVVRNDGDLVFYSRNNKILWATNTARESGAPSKLTLTGAYDVSAPGKNTICLQVYDYSNMRVASVLYKGQ